MISICKRWWWVAAALFLAVGLWRIRFDVEVLNLLPGKVAAVQGLKLYQKHFTNSRELLITLRAPDAQSAESAARRLAESLGQETNLISTAIWQPPWAEHPEQMSELIAYLWLNQRPEELAQFLGRFSTNQLPAILQDAREQLATSLSPMELGRLSYDPYGFTRLPSSGFSAGIMSGGQQDWFASADGSYRVVFIESKRELPNYRACAAWLKDVQNAVGRCQVIAGWPENVVVRYTGSPAFVAEIATGMEGDMKSTIITTLLLIMALFWWAHRSWKPLMWLVTMLGLVLMGALASGGLIFGTLNAVSLGFGAILLGLAVDCGLVVYHEAVASPGVPEREIRQLLFPSMAWSALTTSAAFLLLNFAGLPGLSQLGTLVGIGVLLAPLVMVFIYLPIVLRRRLVSTHGAHDLTKAPAQLSERSLAVYRGITLATIGAAVIVLCFAWPAVDRSSSPLKPKNIPAQIALTELETEMNRQGEPILVVISGRDEAEVARRLDAVSARLEKAETAHELQSYMLPTALWPHGSWQQTNRLLAAQFVSQAPVLQAAALKAGFTSNALALTESVLQSWKTYAGATNLIWPTNASCQWMLKRAVARNGGDWLAAGTITPGTNGLSSAAMVRLDPNLSGVWLTSWSLLGEEIFRHVQERIKWLVVVIILTVGLCLWLAFRRWREVLLSFAALGFTLLTLQAVMGLAGWSWNLMNLTTLPLLLGAGVDYTIHVQVSMRRFKGNILTMRAITGRAIFLCAVTNIDGFGANVMSNNPGLASIGLVCACGVAIVYLTSVFLLPAWWNYFEQRASTGKPTPGSAPATSSFYGVRIWRLGLAIGRAIPASILYRICLIVAEVYYRFQRQRRETVIQNLLPLFQQNRAAAEKAAHELFRQFALKLADLWRFESGVTVEPWFAHLNDWNVFVAAQARGRGVLLLTPHLGNWELGGPLLASRGVKLLVLTKAEPGGLTEMRRESRARWGIETLVVGEDAFAFVEIIKRLQDGATVALLVDRPPDPSAVTVELFGLPFKASIAAAELARATGCALLGVCIVRDKDGYTARVLPEFNYDRRALGSRDARQQLTQDILRAFEPSIRQYASQWYHFVPLWTEATVGRSSKNEKKH